MIDKDYEDYLNEHRFYKHQDNDESMMNCVLCDEQIKGYGHNPHPLADEGKCCDSCNADVVSERIERAFMARLGYTKS